MFAMAVPIFRKRSNPHFCHRACRGDMVAFTLWNTNTGGSRCLNMGTQSSVTTNVSYVYCVAYIRTWWECIVFNTARLFVFHFPERVFLPPRVCHYWPWKETGKVSHSCTPRANLMPHAVRFSRDGCQFCGSPMDRLGCGFLNGLDWLVLSSEWSIVIFWGFENR